MPFMIILLTGIPVNHTKGKVIRAEKDIDPP